MLIAHLSMDIHQSMDITSPTYIISQNTFRFEERE